MPDDLQRIEDLIVAAMGKPTPEERAAFLTVACAGDEELRGQVDALLKVREEAPTMPQSPGGPLPSPLAALPSDRRGETPPDGGFPSPTGGQLAWALADQTQPASSITNHPSSSPESHGTRIGPYHLLQRLGEGGMGAVWMAEQTEPVRRMVALKVIKPGMDSSNVLARFEAERQALALMEHQNIARVFDAGTTQAGRPFFVMELVKGIPITQYCDEQRLSIRERLELFMPVCQAIQHAHQKGIIHRDIKPGNVLVAQYDGKPVPKVIDFGIAKATGQQLTERTLFTELGALLGTLEYMSPEQAELNQLDIDTRSDIYSLGVLLYQLLTGTTPLSRETAQKGALDELLRCIREQEPPKPSTRLSNLVAADVSRLKSNSELRNPKSEIDRASSRRLLQDKEQLTRLLRGDLDWIVMKALEKDRNRRYETANGLAMDIQRHLQDEPVLAGPPTARYRLQKFARKHRVAVAVAAGFVLLLTAATIVSAVLGLWANREKTRAITAETKAESRAQEAIEAGAGERAMLKFFQKDVLSAARAQGYNGGLGRDVTMRAALDAAEPKVGKAFADRPIIEAALRGTLGVTYHDLGDFAKAIQQLERALELLRTHRGRTNTDTLAAAMNLAVMYESAGRLDLALPLAEEAFNLLKTTLGRSNTNTITAMHTLASTYLVVDQLDKAIALFKEASDLREQKLGPNDPYTLSSKDGLAKAYRAAGHLERALPIYEETAKRAKESLGPDDGYTLSAQGNLANAYQEDGRIQQALPLREDILKRREATQGPTHPDTLTSKNNLGMAYLDANDMTNALRLLEETLQQRRLGLGSNALNTLFSMHNLAGAYMRAERAQEAVPLYEETIRLLRAKLRPGHRDTLASMGKLALAYRKVGQLTQAVELAEEVVKLGTNSLGIDHPFTLTWRRNLAMIYESDGRLDKAIPVLEETLVLSQSRLGLDDSDTIRTMRSLATAYTRTCQFPKAEPLLVAGYESLKKRDIEKPSPSHAHELKEAGASIVQLYQTWGKPEQAAEWQRKSFP